MTRRPRPPSPTPRQRPPLPSSRPCPPRGRGGFGESTPPLKPVEPRSTFSEIESARPVAQTPRPGAELVPTARGTLGVTPLAHVLVYMLDHALTGSIVFREPGEIDHVLYFQLGAVSKVQIARPTSRIGDELVGSGLVTARDGQRSGRGGEASRPAPRRVPHRPRSRDPRGASRRRSRRRSRSRVAAIVNLPPETTYSFFRDVDLLGEIESEGVVSDPLNVILATVRAWNDRARIRATLSRISQAPTRLPRAGGPREPRPHRRRADGR